MVNDTALYGLGMVMNIRFNRKLTEKDYVIPGGYEMVFAGKSVSFDFQESCVSINNNDPTILHCEVKHPDFSEFDEFLSITADDLRYISEIVDCYVYIGEECEPELNVTEIISITFWPADGDPVDISKKVIKKYNKKLKG